MQPRAVIKHLIVLLKSLKEISFLEYCVYLVSNNWCYCNILGNYSSRKAFYQTLILAHTVNDSIHQVITNSNKLQNYHAASVSMDRGWHPRQIAQRHSSGGMCTIWCVYKCAGLINEVCIYCCVCEETHKYHTPTQTHWLLPCYQLAIHL